MPYLLKQSFEYNKKSELYITLLTPSIHFLNPFFSFQNSKKLPRTSPLFKKYPTQRSEVRLHLFFASEIEFLAFQLINAEGHSRNLINVLINRRFLSFFIQIQQSFKRKTFKR